MSCEHKDISTLSDPELLKARRYHYEKWKAFVEPLPLLDRSKQGQEPMTRKDHARRLEAQYLDLHIEVHARRRLVFNSYSSAESNAD